MSHPSSNTLFANQDPPQRTLAPLAPSSTNGSIGPPNLLKTQSIITNKEWIIPPRPKPGRKPATDTPPTRRKAQNRAAQRAFRSRRAAKVGELEEQMKALEEEQDVEKEELTKKIGHLENQVQDYQALMRQYGDRIKMMERELLRERNAKPDAIQNGEILARPSTASTDTVPLPNRNLPPKADVDASYSKVVISYEPDSLGCGGCDATTRCRCIDEVFEMHNLPLDAASKPPSKRPRSPAALALDLNKRPRPTITTTTFDAPSASSSTELEIDFTTKQSLPTAFLAPTAQSDPVLDSCGFCRDGATCLCAELAADAVAHDPGRNVDGVGPPPPAETSTIKYITPETLPNFSYSRASTSSQNPCQRGPGTCSQCQADPTSTLFCKSLAATRTTTAAAHGFSGSSNGGSGGGGIPPPSCANPNGCGCSSQDASSYHSPTRPSSHSLQPTPTGVAAHEVAVGGGGGVVGPTLTCTDAFTTLSRHPAFDRASDELGVWLPRLATVTTGVEGRTPFEIEAASVMGVLKFFDRRFGRDGNGAGGGTD